MVANTPSTRVGKIALIGNPNTGKTTLFNVLTGLNQKVGNYPGVTVERKAGFFHLGENEIELIDLPGCYSLASRSPDEMVVTDVLSDQQQGESSVDVILAILDASNLRRNLYLVSQLLEIGKPVVVALNMIDIADSRGLEINVAGLSTVLGVPVVKISATRKHGIEDLNQALQQALQEPASSTGRNTPIFPETFRLGFYQFKEWLQQQYPEIIQNTPDPKLMRIFVDQDGLAEKQLRKKTGDDQLKGLDDARKTVSTSFPLTAIETKTRYDWVATVLENNLVRPQDPAVNLSDRLDQVLTHRLWGTIIFFVVMTVVFQSIYSWAGPFMGIIEGAIGAAGAFAGSVLPEGALRSLVVDGVIAGVGAVVIFVPQIAILFLFIAILEDCGYMPRAAFLMDRLLSFCGLSGKSFIPMLSSFACAVPGIMATRTIEDHRDRLVTILVAPLMSCSARLPVYLIFIAAFIPSMPILGGWLNLQGMVLLAMYLVGVVVAIPVAWLMRKFMLRTEPSSFVLEMPSYKIPSLQSVAIYIYDRVLAFLARAGTIIFAATIVIWALSYFPRNQAVIDEYESEKSQTQAAFVQQVTPLLEDLDFSLEPGSEQPAAVVEAIAANQQLQQAAEDDPLAQQIIDQTADHQEQINSINAEMNGALVRSSALGIMGRAIEPVVEPLGWDWRIGMATLASFPAREVIIATLGTIFNLGDSADAESVDLRQAMRDATRENGQPLFSIAVALSIMVFFALCSQCVSTLAVIKRETNSWRWPIVSFTYMTLLAYFGAMVTYQLASRLGL